MSNPLPIGVVLVTTTGASAGLTEVLKGLAIAQPPSEVIGFRGGPRGLLGCFMGSVVPITSDSTVEDLGFGSWTDVPDVTTQMLAEICEKLDTLVVVSGVDELARTVALTDSLGLSVYVIPHSRNCHIIHDLYYPNGSLGFDSARRALCEYVGNIAVDCLSSKKYWHFVRVGDPILTVHVALSVHVNAVVLPRSEATVATEFASTTFRELVTSIQQLVIRRYRDYGLRTGVILISNLSVSCEYPDLKDLEKACETLESSHRNEMSAKKRLSPEQLELLVLLPKDVRVNLLKTGKLVAPSPEAVLAHAVRRLLLDDLAPTGVDFRAHYLGHESRSPRATRLDQVLGRAIGAGVARRVSSTERCLVTYDAVLTACSEKLVSFVSFNDARAARLLERRGYQVKPELLSELSLAISGSWRYACFFSSVGSSESSSARDPSSCSSNTVRRVLPLEPHPVNLPHRSVNHMSCAEIERLQYIPETLSVLQEGRLLKIQFQQPNESPIDQGFFFSSAHVTRWVGTFDNGAVAGSTLLTRVGVVFLGSQAPGYHNVVWGLFLATQSVLNCELVGFLGGAIGLNEGFFVEISSALVESYKNQGGQDMLGHFGGSLELDKAIKTITNLRIDGLVIVGGLNAAKIALDLTELLGSDCSVLHVPATFGQDCDSISHAPLGFDTVATVFGDILANLRRDAISAGLGRRYFVAVAGTGELAVAAVECTGHAVDFIVLSEISEISSLEEALHIIEGSSAQVVVIPESWTRNVEEFTRLLGEVDEVLERLNCKPDPWLQADLVQAQLSDESASLFKRMSRDTQLALVLGGTRHPETKELHFRNFQVEKVLKALVRDGEAVLCQSLNYQGRSSLPSDRDCNRGFLLGYAAGSAVKARSTGVCVTVDSDKLVEGLPLFALLNREINLGLKEESQKLLTIAAQRPEAVEDLISFLDRGLELLTRSF